MANHSIYLPTPQKSTKNMKFEANNDIDNVNIVIINICSLFSTKGPPTGKKKRRKTTKKEVNKEGANKGNMIPLWFLPGHFGNEIAKLPVVFKTLETFFWQLSTVPWKDQNLIKCIIFENMQKLQNSCNQISILMIF